MEPTPPEELMELAKCFMCYGATLAEGEIFAMWLLVNEQVS